MEENIKKFKEIAIKNFSNKNFVYHEWFVKYHLEIVERIAMELCDIYKEADRDVVQTLVWFHDFGKAIDELKEKEITNKEGIRTLLDCGFSQEFIDKVIYYWELMEKKNEVDLHTAPIETKIISSADGAAHFVGVFYATYFGDGDDFATTQKELANKMEKDWGRKIVLPEVKKSFNDRYERMQEMIGNFPDKFL
jgi:HD superfamily phosphodiesterase